MARRRAEIDIVLSNGEKAGKTINELTARSAKLAREIKSLDPASKKFADRSKDFDKVSKRLKETKERAFGVRTAMNSMQSAVKRLGVQMLAAFGAREILRGIGTFINLFKEFQQSNANLAAVLGKSRTQIKGLTADAKRLGATTKFTASEVTALQTEFAKLGFSEQQILDLSEATLDLAAASGTDLAEAARVAGSTLRGFGLESEETGRVVDVMAKSFSSSALDMEKFSVAMSAVAPVAATANISLERTTAMLGLLADRGLDASTAGTSLRNIFLDLTRHGISFEEAMRQINTATDANAAALELFGKRGATTAVILAQNGDAAAALTGKLQKAGGAAEAMANEQLDTLQGSLTILNSAWQGFLLSLESGEGMFGKILRRAVDLATSLVGVLSGASSGVSETLKGLQDQRVALKATELKIIDVNTAESERLKLIEDLKLSYPELLGHLSTEETSNNDLQLALKKVNDELINRIVIQKQQDKIDNVQGGLGDARLSLFEKEAEIMRHIATATSERNIELEEGLSIVEQAERVRKLINPNNAVTRNFKDAHRITSLLSAHRDLSREVKEGEQALAHVMDQKSFVLKQLGINQEDYNNKLKENESFGGKAESEESKKKKAAAAEAARLQKLSLLRERFNLRLKDSQKALAKLRIEAVSDEFAKRKSLVQAEYNKALGVYKAEEEEINKNIDFTAEQRLALLSNIDEKRILQVKLRNEKIAKIEEAQAKANFAILQAELDNEQLLKYQQQEEFFITTQASEYERQQGRLSLQRAFLAEQLELLVQHGKAETAEAQALRNQQKTIDAEEHRLKLEKLLTDLQDEEFLKSQFQEQQFITNQASEFEREQARLELQKHFLQKRLDILKAAGLAESKQAIALSTQLLAIDASLNSGKIEQQQLLNARFTEIADLRLQAARDATQAVINLFGEETAAGKAAAAIQKVLAIAEVKRSLSKQLMAATETGLKIQSLFPPASIPIGKAYTAVAKAASIAGAASQVSSIIKAERGFAAGKVLRGPSHAGGGIPIEAEGDEIILAKGVYRDPYLRAQASALNVAAGGISFEQGGPVPLAAPTTSAGSTTATTGTNNLPLSGGVPEGRGGSMETDNMIAAKLDTLIDLFAQYPEKLTVQNNLQEVKKGIEALNTLENRGF